MRNQSFIACFTTALLIGACNMPSSKNKQQIDSEPNIIDPITLQSFGEQITADNSITLTEAIAQLGSQANIHTKVKGTVVDVCQAKGCWMNVAVNDSQVVMVRFKDYAFFMPKDIAGKEAIIQGELYWDTISIEMLHHYGEDAGKSANQIAAINKPEFKPSFEAHGVLIK